jgi:hypothetical protein
MAGATKKTAVTGSSVNILSNEAARLKRDGAYAVNALLIALIAAV